MNDDFLAILRTEPRPAFADALWQRLEAGSRPSETTRPVATAHRAPRYAAFRPVLAGLLLLLIAVSGVMAVSPEARAAVASLWHNIPGLSIHEQHLPNITELTPPAGQAGGTPGRTMPTMEAGGGLPVPFAQALAAHRARGFKAPDSIGSGWTPDPTASANAGYVQGVSEFRWTNAAGLSVVFDVAVRPAGQAPGISSVGVGSVTETRVNSSPALYIEGDWSQTSPSGEWDPNALHRLVWYEGDTEYQVATTDLSLGMPELVKIATSAH